jgi:HCOMODA/2-hydroxy-3-carboxy-muconic semialdehyde decarboxylase
LQSAQEIAMHRLAVSLILALAAQAAAAAPDPKLIEDLVAANRILAHEGLLDGWGHVSVRVPGSPERYLMARNVPAELVTAADILEYDLDSKPLGGGHPALYTERYIHGEIYRARPDVMAVVHTHAPPLIPFGVTRVPLKAMYHRAAFVAFGIPVFEIRDTAGMTDMLIRNAGLGRALAASLADKPAVLMRGHGATVTAPSLARVVGRTYFLSLNATLQMEALRLGGEPTYLDLEEAKLIEAREGYGLARAWEVWKKKALAK